MPFKGIPTPRFMMEKLNLMEVVNLLGLEIPTDRPTIDIICPSCGPHRKSKRKTLNINFIKDVWRCNACGAGGGVLAFWAYFRDIDMSDNKAIAADIKRFLNKDISMVKKVRENIKTIEALPEKPIAEICNRSKTYVELLNMLELSPEHLESLKKRGLPENIIHEWGYRSYPLINLKGIAQKLQNSGCVLEGVPGFFINEKTGEWMLREMPSGILIPSRNGFSQIESFQVRRDTLNKDTDSRYLTLSSINMNYGTGAKAFCHIRIGKRGLEEIILTEGPLKGDIISFFTGYTVVSIPGVNSQVHLGNILPQMKEAGLKKVHIAFDMDMYSNIYVQKALETLKEMLCNNKLRYDQLIWSKNKKGLDDYLQSLR